MVIKLATGLVIELLCEQLLLLNCCVVIEPKSELKSSEVENK